MKVAIFIIMLYYWKSILGMHNSKENENVRRSSRYEF